MTSCCQTQKTSKCTQSKNAQSNIYWKLGIAIVIAGQSMMWSLGVNMTDLGLGDPAYWWIHGALIASSLIVTLLLGGPLFKNTVNAIKERKVTVEALFLLSFIGAFIGSVLSSINGIGAIYYEVVSIVFIIYTLGKLLGSISKGKALAEADKVRQSFDSVFIINEAGHREQMPIELITKNHTVSVLPGGPITVDGTIIQGSGYIQETALTGEPIPVSKSKEDPVLAGTYCVDGKLWIRPTELKGNRKIDAILDIVERAKLKPSNMQAQADRIMQWFFPLVVCISLGTFIFWNLSLSWPPALFHSMSVLLVACPCALGLATPVAIWSGLWRLSTLGIVSRSGELIDALAKANRILFDKTGTLSKESMIISSCLKNPACKYSSTFIEGMIRTIQANNKHPIAQTFVDYFESSNIPACGELLELKIHSGKGVEATIKGESEVFNILIGSQKLMPKGAIFNFNKPDLTQCPDEKLIYISINETAWGLVTIQETLRDGTHEIFKKIKKLGLSTSILTGDPTPEWRAIEGTELEFGLSATDKKNRIDAFHTQGEHLIYLGDGINDAAAMSLCKASIAMGHGADLTQSTSTAVIMGDTLASVPKAIIICRRIRKKINENLLFAISYNTLGMGLAAAGILNPITAALIMLVSSVFVSVRALYSTRALTDL